MVLEKLSNTDTLKHQLRGRPNPLSQYNEQMNEHEGDRKADTPVGGMEMNNYDVISLHIPYGPRWDARRINKLIRQTVSRPCYVALIDIA